MDSKTTLYIIIFIAGILALISGVVVARCFINERRKRKAATTTKSTEIYTDGGYGITCRDPQNPYYTGLW